MVSIVAIRLRLERIEPHPLPRRASGLPQRDGALFAKAKVSPSAVTGRKR